LRALVREALRDGHWLVFFTGVLSAWAMLYAMQLPDAELYGPEFWAALCRVAPGLAGYPVAFLMWALMTVAMMAPTLVPALTVFDELSGAGAVHRGGFAELIGGYLLVWLGFAGLAAFAQVLLAETALLSPESRILSPWLTALLLLLAGTYQFSTLKQACLSGCTAPFVFFMRHWRDERLNAVRMGLRMGVVCLGCCWALMSLAFVGGTMNLLWMGAATALMVLEKLPQISRYIVRPLGVALILAGLACAAGVGQ